MLARLKSFYWIAFAWLLLIFPIWNWATYDRRWLVPPNSPVDRIHYDFAQQWRFLDEARHSVLPGSSYTVRAEDPDLEMSLFMFSLGLCTRRKPMPMSYYSTPTPYVGKNAEYIIAFRDYTGGEEGLQLVTRFRDGSVYRRPWRAQ